MIAAEVNFEQTPSKNFGKEKLSIPRPTGMRGNPLHFAPSKNNALPDKLY